MFVGLAIPMFGQMNIEPVRLECSNAQFVITLDTLYQIDKDSYEEGLFWTILTAHADVLEVRCGGLQVDKYLNDKSTYKVIEKCVSSSRIFYRGINTQTNLPWILIKFTGSKFVVTGESLRDGPSSRLYDLASTAKVMIASH